MNNKTIKNLLKNVAHVITYALGTGLIAAMLCSLAFGQASTGGASPLALQGGAPTGSYALSNIDNVNLFNGNLNFRLPLLNIGGRGSAQHTIALALEKKWYVEKFVFGNQIAWTYNEYIPNESSYGPGMMHGYHSGFFPQTCAIDQTVTFNQTLTKLIFRTGDGTEYEFLSSNTPGVATVQNCNPSNYNRGLTFRTIDGSGMTFISDAAIQDIPYVETVDPSQPFTVSGYLLMPDGTRFRIENSLVTWERDRNGNRITFTYGQNGRVTSIQDSLNRTVTINYGVAEGAPYGTSDQIIYQGYEGAPRIIRVSYSSLSNSLRSTQPGDPTPGQTCYDFNTNAYNPNVVSSVWLPDGVRRYILLYNCFGELARVVLPTGGALEYDHGAGLTNGAANGTFERPAAEGGTYPQVYRRVLEKRTYPDGTTLAGKITFGRQETFDQSVFNFTSDQGFVQVDERSTTGTLITRHKHYFLGSASPSLSQTPWYNPPAPLEGREWKTERVDTDGSTILQRVTHSWENPTVFGQGPHITQTDSTLVDTNQVSRTTFNYDQFNNQTDAYEYDFGAGAPGAFVRRSHSEYLVTNPVNQTDYTATSIYLRSLPSEQWVSSDLAGNNKVAYVRYEYDQYIDDTRHKPLVLRPNITGLDSAYSASTTTTRGNVTGLTSYIIASSQTGPLIHSTQYDVAGNAIASIDGIGNKTTLGYADSFCNGATCGGTYNSNTYAFVASSTSPVPDASGLYGSATALVTSNVYDFWTGQASSSTDANNTTTSFQYNDPFDRLKVIIRPTGGGRTDFEYGDTIGNLFVRTLADLDATRRTESYQYFDGFGRATETRTYEGGTNYIAVQQQYDALGRVYKRSNPFRPWQSESPLWTTTEFDALDRVKTVTAPDNAVVSTAYNGDQVLVTDQAGKKRLTSTNALGQLKDVWEITPSDPAQYPGIEAVSFGAQSLYGFLTHYDYDVLADLIKVMQGSQQRFFMYDSLKRLIRARNPEQSTFPGLNLSDPLTGNSAWSIGYQYDANGNLTQRTDARGVVSTYVYDALNRNTTTNYSNTSINPDVSSFYDGAINGKGRFWYNYAGGDFSNGSNVEHIAIDSYDALGKPVVQRQIFKLNGAWGETYRTERAYNRAGAVTSQTYPSGHTVSYSYDAAGRTSTFTGYLGDGAWRTYANNIDYSPFGGIQQEQFGTQIPVYHKNHYNRRGQLFDIRVSTVPWTTDQWNWNRGAIVNYYSANYGWEGNPATPAGPDNNGNVLLQQHWVPTDDAISSYTYTQDAYSYDSLNRLQSAVEAHGTPSWQSGQDFAQLFVYDRWGNRTINPASWGTGINNKQFTVDTATNRLGVPSGQPGTMTYDAAGNLTTDTYTGVGNRTYDAENRMTTAADNTGQTSRYTYNAEGKRVRRQVASSQEEWLIYGIDGELLAEYQAGASPSAPEKEYGYRNGQLLVTATGRFNVAVAANGAVATASTAHTCCGFSTTGAINGNNRGPWGNGEGWNDATPDQLPDWFQVDFAGSRTIDEIDVFSLHDNYNQENTPTETQTFSLYGLINFEVQYWNGSSWATVPGGSVTGNNKVWRKFTFAPITTSKIRLWITSVPDSWSRLVELQAWGTGMVVTNLAVNKPASQSSTGWGGLAQLGADGNTDGNFSIGSVTHTLLETQPWWQVDLQSMANIQNIKVWNRTDCCGERLSNFYVFVSDNPFTGNDVASTQNQPGVSTYYVTGQAGLPSTISVNRTGRYVRVQLGGNDYLSVAEVQVFGGGGADVRWLVPDQLGTPRIVLDQTGSLANVKRHDYLPFGEELFAPVGSRTAAQGYTGGDAVRQQFTLKERDIETGLDYFLARYYSSTQGRFITTDQFDGNPSRLFMSFDTSPSVPYANLLNPQTLNLYAYVLNDPLSNVDEDGHQSGKKPLPGNSRYKIRPDLRNPNDSPNIHVFDKGGRREIGRVAIKPGGNEWEGKVPEAVKASVEEYIRVKGIQPRLPGQPLQPDVPPETAGPQPEINGETGGRILRGTNNAVSVLAFILGAINEYRSVRDAEINGYYMNYQGQFVITDLSRAAQHFPRGYYLEFGGHLWKPQGNTWIPVDPCGCELQLKNGELSVVYKTD
jgi:RHS repeat-associated protein